MSIKQIESTFPWLSVAGAIIDRNDAKLFKTLASFPLRPFFLLRDMQKYLNPNKP